MPALPRAGAVFAAAAAVFSLHSSCSPHSPRSVLNFRRGAGRGADRPMSKLETKSRHFTAKMSDRELEKLIGIIEDILDERAIDRSLAGKYPSVPGEKVEAYLTKKFGLKFE
jgi:hypothetical protein